MSRAPTHPYPSPSADRDGEVELRSVYALARAIMLRAVRDFVRYRGSTDQDKWQLYRAARDWIFTDQASTYFDAEMEIPKGMSMEDVREVMLELNQLTSYLGVCAILEVDPVSLRNRVRDLRPRDVD